MLQVDFFWTYAIGAHFAVAAARQLKDLPESNKFVNKYFITLVLFMAIFFGSTGMVLLWNFPHWETMQVFWTHVEIPLWFLLLWFVTNVTNAILAYAICWYFIKKGQDYKAHIQWIIGYFIFFFVLIYGWDGTGWQRFTWDATLMGQWSMGSTMGLAWFGSNVAITLYILGVVFLTPYLYITTKWAAEGMRNDPEIKDKVAQDGIKPQLTIGLYALVGVGMTFLLAFASAGLGWLFTSLLGYSGVNAVLGGLLGVAIVAVTSYFLGFRKGMPIQKFIEKFLHQA